MIYKYWHKFWFQEQSPLPVALFRICFGFLVLQKALVELLPNFSSFFGMRAVVDTSTLFIHWWPNNPIFDIFLLLPQDNFYRLLCFWLFIVFTVFLTVGFCTRLSSIIVYLGLLSLDNQCPFILNGGDDMMRLLSFLLIFAPAGTVWSIDARLKNSRQPQEEDMAPPMARPWAQRMMQVQLSLAYFSSFICKIVGYQWQGGTAAYYASHLSEFQKFPLPWLADHAPGYQFLTYYTLAVELSMATLVWYKPLRYWVLLAGLVMHAGIDWTMNLPYFEFLFVSCYLNFIEPADLEKLIKLGKGCLGEITKWLEHKFQFFCLPAKLPIHFFVLSPNLQFPVLFIVVIAILIIGAQAVHPLRERYLSVQNKYSYEMRLFKTQVEKHSDLKLYNNLPDNDERKLATEEGLATVWSLLGAYQDAATMLRHVCKGRIEQNMPYNPALVKTMSSLGNIYLETGHLDAAELCYQTLLNYDLARAPKANVRAAIDLNNLAVIVYFRSLINPDKTEQNLALEKANNLYIQGLDKLHLTNLPDGQPVTNQQQRLSALTAIDILSNQYLSLRDSCHIQEGRSVKAKLAKLKGKFI